MYTILTPVIIAICALKKVDKELLSVMTDFVLYLGITLWGTFGTSFTGYTVARSADKRVAGNSDLQTSPSRLLGALSKLGHAIS
jgi:hypothetical protein